MQDYNHFFQCVMELLYDDEDTCLALIQSHGISSNPVVHLPEGDVSTLDALCYARVLCELGQASVAECLVHEVIALEFGAEAAA
ncbi:MAG: hypothetical protein GWP91_11375 [Rhodobacterales bacterium]|nr:hypothetical protein [Rhodobacterales bacterium]